jgi:hypothetical protein
MYFYNFILFVSFEFRQLRLLGGLIYVLPCWTLCLSCFRASDFGCELDIYPPSICVFLLSEII